MRENFYCALVKIEKILSEEATRDEKLEEICCLLSETFPNYNWVGFYLAQNDSSLKLGPYKGAPTEHKMIPCGKGVCGRAIQEKRTLVIENVDLEENYLSCSSHVKSEIVVPVYKEGIIAAELDIDSHSEKAFDVEDREFLEAAARRISSVF